MPLFGSSSSTHSFIRSGMRHGLGSYVRVMGLVGRLNLFSQKSSILSCIVTAVLASFSSIAFMNSSFVVDFAKISSHDLFSGQFDMNCPSFFI